MLIALYERAVGFYASLVGINAYHQPGVEAGKKAAGKVIALKPKIIETLRAAPPDNPLTAEGVATNLGQPDDVELIFKVLEHLSANPGTGVQKIAKTSLWESTYAYTL